MKKLYSLIIITVILLQIFIVSYSANAFTNGTYKITASSLYIRKGASTDYGTVTSRWGSPEMINRDSVVYVSKINGNWGYVENYNDVSGWICLDYAEKTDLSKGTPYDGSTDENITKSVIDVSEWNGLIDWHKVAEDNIWGTVIRIGRTSSEYLDTAFEYNYYNAVSNGIQTGCYYYSYARTVAKAKSDAQRVIKFLKSKNYVMTMPVYYDMEDSYIGDLSKKELTDITYTFCKALKDAGYMSGVYCNTYWAEEKLDMSRLSDFEVWIAEWNKTCSYKGTYKMWQYTDKGDIKGIDESYTDLDWCYCNYPYIIRKQNLNGLSLPVTEKPTEDPYRYEENKPDITINTEPVVNEKCIDGTYSHNCDNWTVISQPDKNGNPGTKRGLCTKCNKTVYVFYSESENIITGNLNFDGKITVKDARLLLKFCAKTIELTDIQKICADINNDGKINIKDARVILRIVAKIN